MFSVRLTMRKLKGFLCKYAKCLLPIANRLKRSEGIVILIAKQTFEILLRLYQMEGDSAQ